jgi:Predicted membrane protein
MAGLAVFSFTEAFINPIPISPIFASVTVMGFPLWTTFLVVVIANLLGAVVGFYLGKWLGHPLAVRLFGKKRIDKAEVYFAKWGEIGVFVMAFTFLPFKVAAWAAGIFEMRFWHFMAAAIVGRVLHFLFAIAAVHLGLGFLGWLIG